MRVLLGIILGGLLTVGAAYLYDNHQATVAASTHAQVQRPLVNWDVVGTKWGHVTARARQEWNRYASK